MGKLPGAGAMGPPGQQVRGKRKENRQGLEAGRKAGLGLPLQGDAGLWATCAPSPGLCHLGADQGPTWGMHLLKYRGNVC